MAGVAVDRLGARRACCSDSASTLGLVAAAYAPDTTALVVALVVFGLAGPVAPVAGAGALAYRGPKRAGLWACARPQFRSAGRSPPSRTRLFASAVLS